MKRVIIIYYMEKFTKKPLIFFIVFLLIFLTFSPVINSKIFFYEPKEFNFSQKIRVIEAESSYDYGYKVGEMFRLKFKILDVILNFGFIFKNESEKNALTESLKEIEQYSPFLFEELQGLSNSTKIKIERILFLSQTLFSNGEECTTSLSTGNATKNNETFVTFNVDLQSDSLGGIIFKYILRSYTYYPWVVKFNSTKHSYAFLGIPIINEWPMINEFGLSWAANGLHLANRSVDTGEGIATNMLERFTMMTCKNVTEAAELWKNSERASGRNKIWPHFWDNSNSMWADAEEGILSIEQTHNHIITVFGNSTEITKAPEGILWHANHHQWLEPDDTGSAYPEECLSSMHRANRIKELLIQNHGNITLDILKNIMRDHGGGSDPNKGDSYDICRHGDENNPGATGFSWIIEPKKHIVHLTHNAPCKSTYITHDLSEFFNV